MGTRWCTASKKKLNVEATFLSLHKKKIISSVSDDRQDDGRSNVQHPIHVWFEITSYLLAHCGTGLKYLSL